MAAVFRRRAWGCVVAGIMLLSLSVLGWGLHDKLSLYTPPHTPPVSAKAKLLSEQERPNRTVSVAALIPPPTAPVQPVAALEALASVSLALSLFASTLPEPVEQPVAALRSPLLLRGNSQRRPPPVAA